MQHQYWVTKRTVLRKLGSKEDECVISSDAELDAKLELFRSISDSCALLQRVLDQYQERVGALAQEEGALGRFLKDAGRGDAKGGAGKLMATAGKGLAGAGQQRLALRSPLLRLHHELDTFRARAVSDTRRTLAAMERARGDYRAALSWMKAASARLDPEGRGVAQFRKAQAQVRHSKRAFDRLALDCLQKVDLLAAARCNLFSHALAAYHAALVAFASRAHHTLRATSAALQAAPRPELGLGLGLGLALTSMSAEDGSESNDRLLYFQDEFKDAHETEETNEATAGDQVTSDLLEATLAACALPPEPRPAAAACPAPTTTTLNPDLAGLTLNDDLFGHLESFMPSQLMQEDHSGAVSPAALPAPSKRTSQKDMSAWFKLFAELDPLANPDALSSADTGRSHAA